jgi:hypothetical protein
MHTRLRHAADKQHKQRCVIARALITSLEVLISIVNGSQRNCHPLDYENVAGLGHALVPEQV